MALVILWLWTLPGFRFPLARTLASSDYGQFPFFLMIGFLLIRRFDLGLASLERLPLFGEQA